MPTFLGNDGTALAYHVLGDGPPVVCLPGGPMQDAAYLGDLGGMPSHFQLIMVDPRGTGRSATPEDTESYRCDRVVDDIEALRVHLGLNTMDLLGHSAGANLAVLYAARYPDRLSRLVLVTPSTVAVGITASTDMRREIALRRSGEPWFAEAFAALEEMMAGGTPDGWKAMPFWYGRWDAAAQAHMAAQDGRRNEQAAALFYADDALDVEGTRAALSRLPTPVLLLGGEIDLNTPPSAVTEYAELFPNAELVIQPEASHSPWLDDPGRFVSTITGFLEQARPPG